LENTFLPRATPADEFLVAEAASGVTSAFALLVERHAATVLATVERAIGDHHLARDLAQEIWIKVHGSLARFETQRRFKPWLFAIAMNHVRDNQRKLGRRADRMPLENMPLEFVAKVQDPIDQREEKNQIESALQSVSEPYRSAVHLVDVLGLGYDEAAESLECSKGTVKSRVHRGRLAFQDAYLALAQCEAPREASKS
jgi:RNA polymerase sigma-70 factor (ECF subfamily)